jgi:CheY-like chemotaxis protein
VLVAEDNEFNRKLVVRQLAALGHAAFTASNGNEVLDLLTRETADVLLLDCQMPELDGYQTARNLRQREAAAAAAGATTRPLHIVALTAHALPGDREKCLAAGMNDFLTKPVRIEDIEAALRRAQGGSRPATPVAEAASEAVPVLDASALGALGGDPAGLADLGELFLSSAAAQLERMDRAVAQGDAATLLTAAHNIKGSAVNFGARRLGLLAARMEGNAKLRQLDPAPQTLEDMRAELGRVRDAWQQYLAPR